MAGRRLSLLRLFRRKKKAGPGAAPERQLEEVEQCQALQEDAGRERTEEQHRARGRFRRAAQTLLKFFSVRRRRTQTEPTEVMAQPDTSPTQLKAKPDGDTAPAHGPANQDTASTQDATNPDTAALPELTATADAATTPEGTASTDTTPAQGPADAAQRVTSAEVPAFVRNLHQTLTANVLPEDGLLRDLGRVTDEHPADVALTLLHWAPSCDRAAAVMWRAIMSSGRTAQKVLPLLLRVMEECPLYSTVTSDGDHKDIYSLAATRVVWEILQRLQCPEPLKENSPRLLVAVLFSISFSTYFMPEKVETFWRQCWQEEGLARNAKRIAVHVMKVLLFHLECEDVVMAMDRKAAWDTLFQLDTHRYAVGLLAREMRRVSSPLCRHMGCYLLEVLSQAAETRWQLPAMAFLVEVLDCLDMRECGHRVLHILARPLQSKCSERHRLALRMLLVLRNDPSTADSTLSLTPSLVQLLGDADGELVAMTLAVLSDHLWEPDIQLSRPTALKLAEALQPLFGNDISQVQLLSIHVFHKVMELAVKSARKTLKRSVVQSLLPLFLHCHSDNQHVAKVSGQALLCAARFLKWSDLENLVRTESLCTLGECLLQKDKRKAAKYLRQALPYLQSPQEPVREAALGFIGIAGSYLRGQHKELLLVIQALEDMTDESPAICSLALQTCQILRGLQRAPSSRFWQL